MEELCDDCRNFNSDSSLTLMLAVRLGHFNCVKLLIEAGTDVNTVDKRETPIYVAGRSGYANILQLLIEAGADVNRQEGHIFSRTAVMAASEEGHSNCLPLLIEAGANVNLADKMGSTTLMWAGRGGHDECVDMLILAGADVNAASTQQHTALIMTVGPYKAEKCVRSLLRAGTKINMVNKDNYNALQNDIFNHSVNQDLHMVLFAAGETIDGTTVEGTDYLGRRKQVPVPDYLLHEDLKLNLKHMCRETIRKYLINIDPHHHLFGRIPQLELPSSVTEYLLYNVSLDDDDYNI